MVIVNKAAAGLQKFAVAEAVKKTQYLTNEVNVLKGNLEAVKKNGTLSLYSGIVVTAVTVAALAAVIFVPGLAPVAMFATLGAIGVSAAVATALFVNCLVQKNRSNELDAKIDGKTKQQDLEHAFHLAATMRGIKKKNDAFNTELKHANQGFEKFKNGEITFNTLVLTYMNPLFSTLKSVEEGINALKSDLAAYDINVVRDLREKAGIEIPNIEDIAKELKYEELPGIDRDSTEVTIREIEVAFGRVLWDSTLKSHEEFRAKLMDSDLRRKSRASDTESASDASLSQEGSFSSMEAVVGSE